MAIVSVRRPSSSPEIKHTTTTATTSSSAAAINPAGGAL